MPEPAARWVCRRCGSEFPDMDELIAHKATHDEPSARSVISKTLDSQTDR